MSFNPKKIKVKTNKKFLSSKELKKLNPKKKFSWKGVENLIGIIIIWLVFFLIFLLKQEKKVFDSMLSASIVSICVAAFLWILGISSTTKMRYYTQKAFNPLLNNLFYYLSFKKMGLNKDHYSSYEKYLEYTKTKYQNKKIWLWITLAITSLVLLLTLILFFTIEYNK